MSAAGQPRSVAAVLGGRTGLVGQALVRTLAANGFEVLPLGRSDFDPTDSKAAADWLDRAKPTHVFNAVAYAQVDKAEDEPGEAALLNKTLPAIWSRLAAERDLYFVHYSTDFVFPGTKDSPYLPDDRTGPGSVYGSTKLAGEAAVLAAAPRRCLILRTAWLFGPDKTNFVRKILDLAQTREELTIVHDQVGSPTYVPDLAVHSLDLVRREASGVFHVVNSGQASWCELAAEAVHAAGLHCRVRAIPSSSYPQKAKRPAYSVLDLAKLTEATGVTPRPWLQALRHYVFHDLKLGM